MKRVIALIILASFISFAYGYKGDYPDRTDPGIVVAEIFGSLVCGAGLAIIGASIGGSSSESNIGPPRKGFLPSFSLEPGIFGAVGWMFGCAGGTYLVGSALQQGGRFLPTLAGSGLGLIILSPVGSVIGYNMSRPKTVRQAFLYQHFGLPTFSFRTEKKKDDLIVAVYDLRLINARF